MSGDWITSTIDDVCGVEFGTRVVRRLDSGSAYPVYGGGGATFSMDTFNRESRVVIARFGMSKECTRFVPEKFFLNDSGLTLSTTNPPRLVQDYLDWYTLSLNETIFNLGRGTAQKNLDVTAFRALPVVYPRLLEEQERIVAILDETFEAIDTVIANVKKKLANAREIFGSYVRSLLSKAESDGWITTCIGDQITLQRGYDITKFDQRSGRVPVVSSGGIKSYHDIAMARAPGVVIGRKGTLGKTFYLEDDFWPHDTTLWIKDFKGNHPRFVYHFFSALEVAHLDSGAANPALNRNQVHPIKTVWPLRDRQILIADKLDSLQRETERLEAICQQKLASLAELKQAILHKAFAGELTARSIDAVQEAAE